MTEAAAPFDVLVALRCTQTLDEAAAQAEAACLDAQERAQAARLRFSQDRRDYLAAHVLLRRTLSSLEPRDPAAWVFARGPGGKPFLADGWALAFNLSHTRGWVACVAARGGTVGMDVERVQAEPDLLALARAHFSASECRALEACDATARAARFAEVWTLKEACAKALGAGIGEGLPAVSFHLSGAEGRIDVAGATAPGLQYALYGLPEARMAVAACAPGGGPVRLMLRTAVRSVQWLRATEGSLLGADQRCFQGT